MPPVYPGVTSITPFNCKKIASTHQKHPAPNIAKFLIETPVISI